MFISRHWCAWHFTENKTKECSLLRRAYNNLIFDKGKHRDESGEVRRVRGENIVSNTKSTRPHCQRLRSTLVPGIFQLNMPGSDMGHLAGKTDAAPVSCFAHSNRDTALHQQNRWHCADQSSSGFSNAVSFNQMVSSACQR